MTKRSSIVAYSKAAERLVAIELGGRRLHAGEWEGRPGDVDVIGPGWAAQVKHRSNVPTYVTEGFTQIKEATEGTQRAPLLVIRTKPGRGRESQTFVMMEAAEWRRLYYGEES